MEYSERSEYILQFMTGLSSCEPFEMAAEFLMDSEKKGNHEFYKFYRYHYLVQFIRD